MVHWTLWDLWVFMCIYSPLPAGMRKVWRVRSRCCRAWVWTRRWRTAEPLGGCVRSCPLEPHTCALPLWWPCCDRSGTTKQQRSCAPLLGWTALFTKIIQSRCLSLSHTHTLVQWIWSIHSCYRHRKAHLSQYSISKVTFECMQVR